MLRREQRLIGVPTCAISALNHRATTSEVRLAVPCPVPGRIRVHRGDAVPTLGMGYMAKATAANIAPQGSSAIAPDFSAHLISLPQPPEHPKLRLGPVVPAAHHARAVSVLLVPPDIIRLNVPLINRPILLLTVTVEICASSARPLPEDRARPRRRDSYMQTRRILHYNNAVQRPTTQREKEPPRYPSTRKEP